MSPGSRASWYVVGVIGLVVAALVLVLGLFPRLNAADDVLNELEPALVQQRVEGARAAITIVSQITDLADPIATKSGTAADEVPKLIKYASDQSGIPPAAVESILSEKFPHTTNLLLSLPLSDVTAELPDLIAFLSDTLKMSPEEVSAAIKENFPGIAQVITALPEVTNGWDQVPGTENLTRFDGTQVTNVPDVRDYFADDVIPILETQRENYDSLNGLPGGPKLIPPLLLILGLAVALFAFVMSTRKESTRGAALPWALVTVVGIVVIVLVVGILGLFSRLSNGQELLDEAQPAFTQERVEGARAGISIVSQIVDLGDPIATENGSAAAEVPKLIKFVSDTSGLPEADVQTALLENFPQTTHLLLALPLSDVSAELPDLVSFLSSAVLKQPPDEVMAALEENFPGIAQVIANAPLVTDGWDNVPGTENLTRFDGSPVTSVPDVRDYFADDVIPVLENQRENFADVNDPFPSLTVFAPLLLAVGLLVTIFGAFMYFAARKR